MARGRHGGRPDADDGRGERVDQLHGYRRYRRASGRGSYGRSHPAGAITARRARAAPGTRSASSRKTRSRAPDTPYAGRAGATTGRQEHPSRAAASGPPHALSTAAQRACRPASDSAPATKPAVHRTRLLRLRRVPPVLMGLRVDANEGLLQLAAVPYDETIVDWIRTLPQRHYRRETQDWITPARREHLQMVCGLIAELEERGIAVAQRRSEAVDPPSASSAKGHARSRPRCAHWTACSPSRSTTASCAGQMARPASTC